MVSESLSRELSKMPDDVANSTLAATARALAVTIDDGDTSPQSKAMCAKQLVDILDKLQANAPAQSTKLDEIKQRRRQRAGSKETRQAS